MKSIPYTSVCSTSKIPCKGISSLLEMFPLIWHLCNAWQMMSIIENNWQIEPTLQHFYCSYLPTKMTIIWRMIVMKNVLYFFFGFTYSYKTITTFRKQVWIILVIMIHIQQKLFFCWDDKSSGSAWPIRKLT